jgi:GR25 family glycosyltransferase involved in LPS biosynthesis
MIIKFIKKNINKLKLEEYYNNNSNINYPFIISLDKDFVRYNNTVKLLESLNLKKTIKFPAIYGKKIKQSEPSIDNKFSNLNSGEIGCFLSHMSVYFIAAQHKNPNQYTLIFEDDIDKKYDFNSNILSNKLTKAISYNPNMIYLGKCYEICKKINLITDDLYVGHNPACFHAYLIKNSFAKILVAYILSFSEINLPIDRVPVKITKNILIFHPSLFYQTIDYQSNLRSRVSQTYNICECNEDLESNKCNLNGIIPFLESYIVDQNITNLNLYYKSSNILNYPFIISNNIIKYKNTLAILNSVGIIDHVRFPAISDYDLDIKNKFVGLSNLDILKFLNHLSIYYIASLHENQDQYTMIFEDNLNVNDDIDMNRMIMLNKVISAIEYGKDIIYLGKCLEVCSLMVNINDDLYHGYSPNCMHAYLIKNSFAKRIVHYINISKQISNTIDEIPSKLSDNILVFHPSLFQLKENFQSECSDNKYINWKSCYIFIFIILILGIIFI